MKMMKHVKKQNKSTKETLKSSLTFKWVSLVAATITVSFVIFSIAIYSLVKQQIVSQERNLTESVATTFQRRLVEIPTSLQISNVVPQLSPNTNRILEGQAPITSNDGGNVFNDDVLATLSNRDTSIIIYNPDGDVVFSNGNVPDGGMPNFSKTENHVLRVETSRGKIHMKIYQKIFSERTHRLTGYLIVDNSMDQQNQVLKSLRHWMIGLSIIAIVIFIGLSYLIVNSVVQPIKKMSQISRYINKDPTDKRRVPDLHRNDELGELATSFNEMLDRMQAYMQQQKQFVGDVSHELRTPLMSIQGYAEGIREGIIPNTQEAAGIIVDESDKMAHLVEDMLTLSNMESIQTQLHLEPVNITDLLYDVIWRLKAAADERGLVFVHHFSSEEVMIEGDEKLLERAVSNIVSNAIRYDNKYLTISVEQLETGVRIELANDGEPIAADDLEHLFERFYKGKSGPFGLGLAITKEIIERHQGTIRATSNEEKTCFIIDLPNTQKHL